MKIFKKTMQILLLVILLLVIGGVLYLQHDRFGAKATGDRLAAMEAKANFRNGAFDNLEHTPDFDEGKGLIDVFKSMLFGKEKRNLPTDLIPVVKTDLHQLPPDSNLFVWFGHSSYLLQLDYKKILVDPVFSKYATPVRIGVKAFKSEYQYKVEDMPESIDILIYTHDHWDHLDYNTFMKLHPRVKHIVTGLGVGAHLEKWGYPSDQITELYWGEEATIQGLKIASATARHFSGRTFKRNTTLWSSFILEGSKKIYVGGDSGYGQHFLKIGQEYGPFDYAILENGQYNELWRYIHMMPEEVIKAALDLRAEHTIPVHSAKFPLANHAWDEPLIRVTAAAEKAEVTLLTPKPGSLVSLDHYEASVAWWKDIY